eukprot:scaffold3_cov273-Pinguiococcus_pyrenoidosus.AAC.19
MTIILELLCRPAGRLRPVPLCLRFVSSYPCASRRGSCVFRNGPFLRSIPRVNLMASEAGIYIIAPYESKSAIGRSCDRVIV